MTAPSPTQAELHPDLTVVHGVLTATRAIADTNLVELTVIVPGGRPDLLELNRAVVVAPTGRDVPPTLHRVLETYDQPSGVGA